MKKLLSLLTLLFLFISCGDSETNDSKTKSSDQVLNLFLGAEPKTLDPSTATGAYASDLLGATSEGLVGSVADEKGVEKVVPAGATSWTISDDGLTYTFNLRKEAKWEDGKPVVAQDYYYGITRTIDPNTGSTYAFILYPIKNAEKFNNGEVGIDEVGVKVLDDYTLEIKLENPTSYFIDIPYFHVMYPQRKDIVEKYGEKYGSEANQLLSNGPYILKEWIHQNKAVLVKNNNFWDKDSYKLEKIIFQIVRDENSRMNLLASGQVDLGFVDKPEWIKQFVDSGDFNVIKRYDLSTNYSIFNSKSRYLKNKKIRKAFSAAIDRDEINRVMFNGKFDVAYGWVSKGIQIGPDEYRTLVPGPLKKLLDETPDPKALLIEGLKELGEDPDPANMTVSYLASGTDSWARKYSELLQQMLKTKLGINLKAEFVEWPVYQKRNKELDYEIGGQAWAADYNDPNTFLDLWISNSNIVAIGWGSPEYDELIAKAAKTVDNKERLEYFKRAEEILIYEDAAIAPTLYKRKDNYIRKYVKNYNPTTIAPYQFKGVYIEGR